jgi:hypothetical protein
MNNFLKKRQIKKRMSELPFYKQVFYETRPFVNIFNVCIVLISCVFFYYFTKKTIFKRTYVSGAFRPDAKDNVKVIAKKNNEFVIYYQAMDPSLLKIGYLWSNGPVLEKSVTNDVVIDIGEENLFSFSDPKYKSLLIKRVVLYNMAKDPNIVIIQKQSDVGGEVEDVVKFTETKTNFGELRQVDVNYTMPIVQNHKYLVRTENVQQISGYVCLVCEMIYAPES